MIVIPPLALEPAHLLACSIPEVDESAGELPWADRVWTAGEILALPEAQKRYKCLAPVHLPPTAAPEYWLDLGETNRWAMFRHLTNAASVGASPLTFTLVPGRRFNSLFLRGLDAHAVVVSITVGGQEVRRIERSLVARSSRTWSDYYFGGHYTQPSLVLHDLPPYSGAVVTSPDIWWLIGAPFAAPIVQVWADMAAQVGMHYVFRAPALLTLPASPAPRDIVQVTDLSQSRNARIDPQGKKIRGQTGVMRLEMLRARFSLIYLDEEEGWF
ncbi:MAG: hypothetical protein J0H52_13250 [Comamonadaceae bacterium]|nr:hypothetical protein [Comamonadaceae bacterium]MBN9369013.1 hypothetical protein [Comamonadaceae bacterium]